MESVHDLQEPWFSLVKLGIKTIDGRLNRKDFANMKVYDIIYFTNNVFGFERICKVIIEKITSYKTFYDYLTCETLDKCLPGIDNIEDGKQVYYHYFNKEDEMICGVRAFEIKVVPM